MHNDSIGEVPHCHECDEMTRIDGINWFPGLFAKIVSLTTLSVLTTTANIVLLYVSCQTKSLVANTKVFFASLCIAHLIGSLVVIPFWIVTSLSPDFAQNSNMFCQFASFFWILMILASFYSLSALSLDRFFIISNPMRYPVRATTHRKLAVVALLWLICILVAAAPVIGWGDYTFMPDAIPLCGLDMKGSLPFTVFLISAGFGLPIVVDIFCCGRIISIARKQSRSMDSRKSSDGSSSSTSSISSSGSVLQPSAKLSKLKQKLNSLRLVFAGTGSFLVCWLPYLCAHIWMTTVRNISHAEESMPYILEFVVMCVALLNGLINPVVLMLSNRDHRREIRTVLSRRFGILGSSSEDTWEPDTDSLSLQTRRIQQRTSSLSQTFHTLQEIKIDVSLRPAEDQQLRKKDSSSTIDSNEGQSQSEVLDLSKLQPSVAANKQEVKRLMSQSSISSIDNDQTVQVKVEYHVSMDKFEKLRRSSVEPNNNIEDPGIVIK
ncbi:ADA1A-like protein [Mya arenaria]|uniref:ADA1A-like protein n=1 Tax=Mya arenaria TaxID=6604 RepID=A0ABY7FRR4_MYAAR|nr:beta-3 adrenergic receptor-like [Mya arenaria]WAR24918.1 ADA1A-like protein [Mya arenaria]